MKKLLAPLASLVLLCVVSCGDSKTSSFEDPRDNRKYKTVKIGEQVWMAENLDYDGAGSVCYDNDPKNCDTHGRLYDWYTAKASCPDGWHLPTEEEWDALAAAVGGSEAAAKVLKAKSGWGSSGNGVDTYSFAAQPSGFAYGKEPDEEYDDYLYTFRDFGSYGTWWTASVTSNDEAIIRQMSSNGESVSANFEEKKLIESVGFGFALYSVRCLMN